MLAVHGGTGGLRRGEQTPEREKALRDGMSAALAAGHRVLTRLVKDASPHVLLAGRGADDFAAAHRLEIVDQSYFWTQQRSDDLQRAQTAAAAKTAHLTGREGTGRSARYVGTAAGMSRPPPAPVV